MKREKWSRAIVEGEVRPIPLSTEQQKEITAALNTNRVRGDLDGFFTDLQWLIGDYRLSLELHQQRSSPGDVATALREMDEALDSLGQKLVTHSAATAGLFRRHLAASLGSDDESSALLSRLRAELRTLKRATASAQREASERSWWRAEHPRSPRRVLAEELAASFARHLDRRPTATDGGPFSDCLRLALEAGNPAKPETGSLQLLVRHGVREVDSPHLQVRRRIPRRTGGSGAE